MPAASPSETTGPAVELVPTAPPRVAVQDVVAAPKAAALPNVLPKAAVAPDASASRVSSSGSAPSVVEPLPVGSKVLHIGDSFAGALGLALGKRLEERGVRSVLKHTDASYLTTWAWDDALGKYLWKYNPDLVLVTLGANELAIVEPEQRERAIKKIVETIGDRPCVWVGIPLWNGPQNGLLEVIRRASAPCRYMDTNALVDTEHMPRMSDGIHPTAAAREAWADVVVDWLARERRSNGPMPWSLEP